MRPFADSVVGYAQAGWTCIVPVPVELKSPPPVGFTGSPTGEPGRDTDPVQLVQWVATHGDWSIALRMPDDVLGIDVDHYPKGSVDKRGNDTLLEHIEKWGPLPATWSSTARGDESGPGLSRIMFFRVPAQRYAGKIGESIEIIQRHHRYAVVAPSINIQAGGTRYRWYDPSGAPCDSVPKPIEFPELPQAWVEGLRAGAAEAGPAAADHGSGQVLLNALMRDEGPECADVASARRLALGELQAASSGSRHDTATGRVHHLVQLGAAGHPGAAVALLDLRTLWEALTVGEGREAEFDRMLLTSARKAVTVVGPLPVDRDPCLMMGGQLWSAFTPSAGTGSDNPDVPPPLEEARMWSVREVIGAGEFDPRGDLDQTISGEVLQRMHPVLRYAVDAGTWLLRGPDRWEVRGDLTRWSVHELADLMPTGNPDAEKGSDERRRADRRKRLMTTAGRNAVGSTMAAAVAAGTHPCSLALTDLDGEAHFLWAGGHCFDLRHCADELTLAPIDPGTPHLNTAACAPADVPTPYWDALLEVVWPDPQIRAWALRVLAVAFTGEPDAALPILLGPQRRGKSQVVALLMSVLGTYALAADPRLLAGKSETPGHVVRSLMGRRLAFIDEGPRENRYAVEWLKQLTGGTSLTGDAKYEAAVTFEPTHTLVLTANAEPTLTDAAIRARVRLIPCEGDEEAVRAARKALGGARRKNWEKVWRAEAPGVLAQMMREAARWLADRDSALTTAAPASIRDKAETVAAEQDPVRTWVEEETEPFDEGTRAGELYSAFVRWCRDRNMMNSAIPTTTLWGRSLTDLGHPSAHGRTGKRRPLKIRQPGGWAPFVTPLGVTGLVTGGDGSAAPAGHTGNGTSTAAYQVPVTSVTGSLTSFIDIKKGEKENTATKGAAPQTRHTEDGESHPDQQKDPVTPTGHTPTIPSQEASAKPKRAQNPDKVSTKLQKAVEERAAKIADAAGERIPLPAAVNRAGEIVALTPERAAAVVRIAAARTGALTVDVETSGYPVGHALYRLRTVQLGGPDMAVVFDPADPAQHALCRELIAEAVRLQAHSATADLVPLAHAGICDESAWERMHDTVILAKLADPQMTGSDPGLKQLAPAVLGDGNVVAPADEARAMLFKTARWLTDTKTDTPLERSGWAQVDSGCTTMIRYAGSDVLDTGSLAVRLPSPPAPVLERERAVQRILARVTHRGVRIDGDQVRRLSEVHGEAREQFVAQVRGLGGIENPGSDSQIGQALTALGAPLPRTKPSQKYPAGQPSVAAAALAPLRAVPGQVGGLVRAVLDFRHHDTVLGTFLGPYRELVERGDGRARPTVYTLGADTGRMSCVRPNLQQLPRKGGVRACLTADPGYMLISADFSSVEVRVMAALSQDLDLIRILAEGADPHAMVAAQAFGPEFTKEDRSNAKGGVFGWAYGGGIPTLAKQLGISEGAMAAIVESLRLIAPTFVRWSEELKRSVRAGRTQLPTYAGRVIHLAKDKPHKAANYAVQGTARELLVDAALAFDQTEHGRGATVIPVHDEIVAMVRAEAAEQATADLLRCMTTSLYGVPITAECDQPSFAWQDAV